MYISMGNEEIQVRAMDLNKQTKDQITINKKGKRTRPTAKMVNKT